MLRLSFDSATRSTGRDSVSRRDFLRVGASVGPRTFLAGTLAGGSSRQSGGRRTAQAPLVILVYLGGGLSHHDSFDLKPEAPEGIRGIYRPIATNVPGTHIGELLPRMARVMDKVALVRSGAHNNDHHETATNWVLSGRFGSPFGDYPAIGAVVAHPARLPRPAAALCRDPAQSVVHLGAGQERLPRRPLRVVPHRRSQPAGLPGAGRGADRAAQRPSCRSAGRTFLQAMDGLAAQVHGNDQIATYGEFQQRAADLILSGEAAAPSPWSRRADRLARPLWPHHVRPELSAGPPAGRARRALRHRQLRRLGPSRARSGTASTASCRSSTRGSRR